MTTLPAEQVTQRNSKGQVSLTPSDKETAGTLQWLSTTTLPYDVVNTNSVGAATDTPAEIDTVMDSYNPSTAYNISINKGFGTYVGDKALVKLGDTTLAITKPATGTKDISAFVAGGFGNLTYQIDASSTLAVTGVAYSMAGKTLVVTTGANAGTGNVVVKVTDSAAQSVLVTVAVTVT